MDVRGIPEKLRERVKEEACKCGYIVVDICSGGRNVLGLEVILDSKTGITLDECARFNRQIVSWIDESGLFPGKYALDVCSPGLDRELKSDDEFLWAKNKRIRVTTREPVEGKSEIKGKLMGICDDGDVDIEEDGGEIISIGRDKIARARLQVARVSK